jgi:hypothetical protein
MTSLVLGFHTRIHKTKCECTFNMFQNDNKNICSIDQKCDGNYAREHSLCAICKRRPRERKEVEVTRWHWLRRPRKRKEVEVTGWHWSRRLRKRKEVEVIGWRWLRRPRKWKEVEVTSWRWSQRPRKRKEVKVIGWHRSPAASPASPSPTPQNLRHRHRDLLN